jgi:hypothetical protein
MNIARGARGFLVLRFLSPVSLVRQQLGSPLPTACPCEFWSLEAPRPRVGLHRVFDVQYFNVHSLPVPCLNGL